MKIVIAVSPAIARFNSFVDRFDLLTLWQSDKATLQQIRSWYHLNDPVLEPLFEQVAREAGYATATQKQKLYAI